MRVGLHKTGNQTRDMDRTGRKQKCEAAQDRQPNTKHGQDRQKKHGGGCIKQATKHKTWTGQDRSMKVGLHRTGNQTRDMYRTGKKHESGAA